MYPQAPYRPQPGAVLMHPGAVAPGVGYAPGAWGGGSATVGVGRDDLVSGEAVALDLPAANFGLRILAGFIDYIAGFVVLFLLSWLSYKLAATADAALRAACSTMSFVLAWAVLPTAVETATRGKTLGHWIVGLRTVRDDAGPIRFRHALTRALIGVVEIYLTFGIPAVICAAINRKSKRIGDLVAGTYVIRDRFSLKLPELATMPPQLGQWAASADIGAVPDELAASMRLFFTRREQYNPLTRQGLAERLVYAVAPYVSPAPPAGAPYEDVLIAILAERRSRATLRLRREGQLRERLLR